MGNFKVYMVKLLCRPFHIALRKFLQLIEENFTQLKLFPFGEFYAFIFNHLILDAELKIIFKFYYFFYYLKKKSIFRVSCMQEYMPHRITKEYGNNYLKKLNWVKNVIVVAYKIELSCFKSFAT